MDEGGGRLQFIPSSAPNFSFPFCSSRFFAFFGCFFKPFIHFLAFKFSFSHFSLSLTLLSASPPSVSSFDCLLFFPPCHILLLSRPTHPLSLSRPFTFFLLAHPCVKHQYQRNEVPSHFFILCCPLSHARIIATIT